MSTICKRFMSVMRRCDVELFLNIGRIFAEIAHFEKRIDMHVELLCRDEFRDAECVNDVQKYRVVLFAIKTVILTLPF